MSPFKIQTYQCNLRWVQDRVPLRLNGVVIHSKAERWWCCVNAFALLDALMNVEVKVIIIIPIISESFVLSTNAHVPDCSHRLIIVHCYLNIQIAGSAMKKFHWLRWTSKLDKISNLLATFNHFGGRTRMTREQLELEADSETHFMSTSQIPEAILSLILYVCF